ncbi:MAG: RHS repeat-associated core domain-containing protein [Candidatus Methanomethyliaceae archaeon]
MTHAVFQGELLVSTTGLTPTRYLQGRGLLAEYTTGWAYPLRDGEGSLRQMADAGGAVTLARTYRPFGSILEEQGTYETAFGFLGAQLDRVSGLLYAGGRYYDPAAGRYLTPGRDFNPYDPRTLNRYAPVQDPTLWLLAPLGLVAGLVGRKRRGGWWLLVLIVVGVGVSGVLVACQPPTPTPQPPTVPSQPPQQPPPSQPPEEPPPAQPQEPAPAPAQSQPSNPVPATPCPEPYLTPKSGYANVRSGPTTLVANKIGTLSNSMRAEPVGQFGREAAGIWWWRIRYSDNGQTVEGWVRSDVVTLVGQVQFPAPKPWISPLSGGSGKITTVWCDTRGFQKPGICPVTETNPEGKGHPGIDIVSDQDPGPDTEPFGGQVSGREVFAMTDGVITHFPNSANIDHDYWMNVLHEHPDGKIYWVQYTHIRNWSNTLRLGVFFEQTGQTILGWYSRVGESSAPHLHISGKEVSPAEAGGEAGWTLIDPAPYIPGVHY